MTNGTGQFIRDYMFPKSEGDTIETISEQLGAYRDIKEKIDVLEDKIGMLKKCGKPDKTDDDACRYREAAGNDPLYRY